MAIISAIPYMIWLILSSVFFALGEYYSKKFGLSQSWVVFSAVMLSYGAGVLLWLPAIVQNNQLSIVGAMWSVMSLMTTVLIGVVIFSEQLTPLAVVGIILGVISVFILSIA